MAFSKPAPAGSKDSTPSYYSPKLSTPSPFICVGGALRESGASLSMPSRTAARACALALLEPSNGYSKLLSHSPVSLLFDADIRTDDPAVVAGY